MLRVQKLLDVISRCRKFGIYFFIFAALMFGGLAIAQYQMIYDQLYDWKLIPRPERLTELYFAKHVTLPTQYIPGQQQTVQFVVHNLEYRRTTYTYTITQQSGDGKVQQQLATAHFTLQSQKFQEITVPIQLIDQGANSKINVAIAYKGIAFGQDTPTLQSQSVFYLITKSGTIQ